MKKGISEQRLKTITARQGTVRWGSDYQPAIRATTAEAPKLSRPSLLYSQKLDRKVHALSLPEAAAIYLALYQPSLFELHEQKVLSTIAAPHPLAGHERAIGMDLPWVPGTVTIADDLGMFSKHPKVRIEEEEGAAWVAFPFVGDLLLYLEDADGPYCVNWTIKATQDDFRKKIVMPHGRARRKADNANAEFRHELELRYYSSVGIPTVRVTLEDIDTCLVNNLRHLFQWQRAGAERAISVWPEFCTWVNASADKQSIVYATICEAAKRFSITEYEAKANFYFGVWARAIHVDLFTPLMIDKPFRASTQDPLLRYQAWFERAR